MQQAMGIYSLQNKYQDKYPIKLIFKTFAKQKQKPT